MAVENRSDYEKRLGEKLEAAYMLEDIEPGMSREEFHRLILAAEKRKKRRRNNNSFLSLTGQSISTAHTDDMVRFLVSSKCILIEDHTLIFFNIKKLLKTCSVLIFLVNLQRFLSTFYVLY